MIKAPLNPYHKLLFHAVQKLGIWSFPQNNLRAIDSKLHNRPSAFWEKKGEEMVLELFKKAALRVPAYKDFLKKQHIAPEKIKTMKDFAHVPLIDKKNYVRAYPVEALCWDGKLQGNTLFSVSSGSSGVPFFWPRGDNLELETSLIVALIFAKFFDAERKSTLFINSFSMGIYIAGVIILNAALRTAELGLPITTITPGVEIGDVLRAIKELSGKYKQIVLSGYPPFVKDIIDSGAKEKIDWSKIPLKFLFATENFSETFRDYVTRYAEDSAKSTRSINIYGTADAGIMGHETPLSVRIRRKASEDMELASRIWGEQTFAPTFVQYYPFYKYFEDVGGELASSGYGGIPLVRYNLHDSGKIVHYAELEKLPSLRAELSTKDSWKLPFVVVFGKSDLTISFYGLKIYPENIREALLQEDIAPFLTGKFVMEQKTKKNQDQYWMLTLELREKVKSTPLIARLASDRIVKTLRKRNLEFNRLYEAIGRKANPQVQFLPKGDSRYFNSRSIKQRWTR